MGIDIRDPDQPVGTLSGGERQSVAIARAIYFGARVLILDEPTSALGVKQAGIVLKYILQARDRGVGVIFITHNPHHAFPVGDHFILLNRGRVTGDYAKGKVTREELVRQMAGGAELDAADARAGGAHGATNDGAASSADRRPRRRRPVRRGAARELHRGAPVPEVDRRQPDQRRGRRSRGSVIAPQCSRRSATTPSGRTSGTRSRTSSASTPASSAHTRRSARRSWSRPSTRPRIRSSSSTASRGHPTPRSSPRRSTWRSWTPCRSSGSAPGRSPSSRRRSTTRTLLATARTAAPHHSRPRLPRRPSGSARTEARREIGATLDSVTIASATVPNARSRSGTADADAAADALLGTGPRDRRRQARGRRRPRGDRRRPSRHPAAARRGGLRARRG